MYQRGYVLQLAQRHKKRRRFYHKDASIIRLRPTHPNHVWSIDFVHDKLDSGRSYKMLTVLDEYTRQALAVAVRTRMGADDILEALHPHSCPSAWQQRCRSFFCAGAPLECSRVTPMTSLHALYERLA